MRARKTSPGQYSSWQLLVKVLNASFQRLVVCGTEWELAKDCYAVHCIWTGCCVWQLWTFLIWKFIRRFALLVKMKSSERFCRDNPFGVKKISALFTKGSRQKQTFQCSISSCDRCTLVCDTFCHPEKPACFWSGKTVINATVLFTFRWCAHLFPFQIWQCP